jgi:hypothetical protein
MCFLAEPCQEGQAQSLLFVDICGASNEEQGQLQVAPGYLSALLSFKEQKHNWPHSQMYQALASKHGMDGQQEEANRR